MIHTQWVSDILKKPGGNRYHNRFPPGFSFVAAVFFAHFMPHTGCAAGLTPVE
jgi:hypothetical protein